MDCGFLIWYEGKNCGEFYCRRTEATLQGVYSVIYSWKFGGFDLRRNCVIGPISRSKDLESARDDADRRESCRDQVVNVKLEIPLSFPTMFVKYLNEENFAFIILD